MLIRRMTLWIVSSCNAVGGFNSLRTLAMEALCTLMVFTCLFCASKCTRYSARDMRGPWTVCLCHWPTGQRPSTESYKRYWKNLEEDQPPYPLQCLGSDAVSGCHGRDGCWHATRITVVP